MTHFAYPNADEYRQFIGCGRFAVLSDDEQPETGYEVADPNIPGMRDISESVVILAPEVSDQNQMVYEKRDRQRNYVGRSLGLAYLLANIRRFRDMRLRYKGDIWCTGDVKLYDKPVLMGVDHFDAKLEAFLSEENEDLLFIVPESNLRENGLRLGKADIRILSLGEFREIVQKPLREKTILELGREELPLLANTIFEAPDEQPSEKDEKVDKSRPVFGNMLRWATALLMLLLIPFVGTMEDQREIPGSRSVSSEQISAYIGSGSSEKTSPPDLEAYFHKEKSRIGKSYLCTLIGIELLENGELADAMRKFEEALRLYPENEVASNFFRKCRKQIDILNISNRDVLRDDNYSQQDIHMPEGSDPDGGLPDSADVQNGNVIDIDCLYDDDLCHDEFGIFHLSGNVIEIDCLYDGGRYKGELGMFSLSGMEDTETNPLDNNPIGKISGLISIIPDSSLSQNGGTIYDLNSAGFGRAHAISAQFISNDNLNTSDGLDYPFGILLEADNTKNNEGYFCLRNLKHGTDIVTSDGQFLEPIGIIINSNGFVYVPDKESHRIQKFTQDEQVLAKIAKCLSQSFYDPLAEKQTVSKRILAVGIDDYNFTGDEWKSLKFAVSDAEKVSEGFSQYGFETNLLRNKESVKSDIMEKLCYEVLHSRPDDTFVFYFAGHGFTDSSGEMFILPYPDDTGGSDSKLISLTEIKELLRLHRGKTYVIADNCFNQLEINLANRKNNKRAVRWGSNNKASFPVWLLGSSPGEKAFESGKYDSGLVTHTLLQYLNNMEDGTNVDFKAMFEYVSKETPRLASSLHNLQQHPVIVD